MRETFDLIGRMESRTLACVTVYGFALILLSAFIPMGFMPLMYWCAIPFAIEFSDWRAVRALRRDLENKELHVPL